MSVFPIESDAVLLSMQDTTHPLATFSRHGFELDDAFWPSVEHYFQGIRFEDLALRERIRAAEHPQAARKLARRYRRRARRDWAQVQLAYMTRGVYMKAQVHEDVLAALLATGGRQIVETSQYDYFWGCGRDTRGHNHYGQILMDVRARLRAADDA